MCDGGERAWERSHSHVAGMPFYRAITTSVLASCSAYERPGSSACWRMQKMVRRNPTYSHKASEWESWALHQAVWPLGLCVWPPHYPAPLTVAPALVSGSHCLCVWMVVGGWRKGRLLKFAELPGSSVTWVSHLSHPGLFLEYVLSGIKLVCYRPGWNLVFIYAWLTYTFTYKKICGICFRHCHSYLHFGIHFWN